MSNPVVITRPLTQAVVLAERVRSLGRIAILFPLLEIHPLADSTLLQAALADLHCYAMVVFVSPNAIHAIFSQLHGEYHWPRAVAIGVMGEGSRAALAAHGVTDCNANIISPHDVERTDSETLLAVLDAAALRGKRVLIVHGENGRELLTNALHAMGVEVRQIAAYRRAAPIFDAVFCSQLQHLLCTKNDWIVTSSEALRVLMQRLHQVGDEDAVAKMQQQQIIVPHVRIAETAQALGFLDIIRTGSGDERLLAALQSRS